MDIPEAGADGVIFAVGGDAAGWSLFGWEGRARFHYNFFGIRRYDLTSPEPLSPGTHTVTVEITPRTPQPGGPADVTMTVDGQPAGELHLPEQIPQRCGTETMDVGMDCVSPVCDDYADRGLFPLTGKIHAVAFDFPAIKPMTGHERLKLASQMD